MKYFGEIWRSCTFTECFISFKPLWIVVLPCGSSWLGHVAPPLLFSHCSNLILIFRPYPKSQKYNPYMQSYWKQHFRLIGLVKISNGDCFMHICVPLSILNAMIGQITQKPRNWTKGLPSPKLTFWIQWKYQNLQLESPWPQNLRKLN